MLCQTEEAFRINFRSRPGTVGPSYPFRIVHFQSAYFSPCPFCSLTAEIVKIKITANYKLLMLFFNIHVGLNNQAKHLHPVFAEKAETDVDILKHVQIQ